MSPVTSVCFSPRFLATSRSFRIDLTPLNNALGALCSLYHSGSMSMYTFILTYLTQTAWDGSEACKMLITSFSLLAPACTEGWDFHLNVSVHTFSVINGYIGNSSSRNIRQARSPWQAQTFVRPIAQSDLIRTEIEPPPPFQAYIRTIFRPGGRQGGLNTDYA